MDVDDASADGDDDASANEEELELYSHRFLKQAAEKKRLGTSSSSRYDGTAARAALASRLDLDVMRPLHDRNDHSVLGVVAVPSPETRLYPSVLYQRIQCAMAFVHYLAHVPPMSSLGKGDDFQAALEASCVWSYLPAAQRTPLTLRDAVRHWQLRFAISFTAAIVLRSGHVLLVFEWLDDGRAIGGNIEAGSAADVTIVVVHQLAPATSAPVLEAVFKASPPGTPCELIPRAYLFQEDEVLTMAGTGRTHDFGPTECSLPAAEALVTQARLLYMNYAYLDEELLTLASYVWS